MIFHPMHMTIIVALALLPRPPIDERPTVIPAGHRAYAMRVDANSIAQVLPGSRVDVIVTTKKTPKLSEVRIVAEKVLVVAMDTEETKGNQVIITVAVTPETAVLLERHRERGVFSVALRPID